MRDAHRNRIATEQALVQHLDVGALDEAQLDQTTLELGRWQTGRDSVGDDSVDATSEAHAGVAKCYGGLDIHCE